MTPPPWDRIFGRLAPFALDVGCGSGEFTEALARREPDWNVLGIEIRQHLVDTVIARRERHELSNLYAVLANANTHLDVLLPPQSVAFVAINFPDPWYKKRHHKRRVVRSDWLRVLTTKLRPGATIHAATDYEPLAMDMLEALESCASLHNVYSRGFASESTTGIVTEREQKHLTRGDPIYRLHFYYATSREGVLSS